MKHPLGCHQVYKTNEIMRRKTVCFSIKLDVRQVIKVHNSELLEGEALVQ